VTAHFYSGNGGRASSLMMLFSLTQTAAQALPTLICCLHKCKRTLFLIATIHNTVLFCYPKVAFIFTLFFGLVYFVGCIIIIIVIMMGVNQKTPISNISPYVEVSLLKSLKNVKLEKE
jgi:ABC-type protease/lipase transport system fused ATPase/permease subunit